MPDTFHERTPFAVDYLLGDNSSQPPSSQCPSSAPGSSDYTGRVRGLWASTGDAGTGDIYKRTWTWNADVISQTDTCLAGSSSPRTSVFRVLEKVIE